jgi:outer membrane immunogenic protein
MKRQLLAGVAITALLGGSALAADMPVKAPPLPGCPGCNWNGFYVGVNVGGSIGHDRGLDAISMSAPGTLGGIAPGVLNPISSTVYSQSPTGWLAGGQVGANWQMGHLVLGAEGDWDWTRQRSNLQINNFIASSVVVAPAAYGYTDQEKINWLATARARVGWASGYTMAYLTGGAAFADIDSNYAFQAAGSGTFASAPGAANFSTTRVGWAIGSGVETSLGWMGANHWSAKLEYLYVDLGTVTNSFAVPLTAAPATSYGVSSSTHIRDNIVRVGVNYRFGGENFGPPPPSTPGPCPTCNWTGFYVGANETTAIGHIRSHETDSLLPAAANNAAVTNPLTDVLHTESPTGWGAGGQLGYNWQTGHLVLGAEGDWTWMNQRDSFSNVNFVASTIVVAPAQVAMTNEEKIKSLATLRGRIGWSDNCFLWYVTGGAAWGRVESNYGFQGVALHGATVFGTLPAAMSVSTTKGGWTLGGGVESTMTWLGLSDRWSSKFEYLYVDLGSITNSFAVPVAGPPLTPAAHNFASTSDIRDHIVRFGVNYRFGG